jgi:hypothetical protein
MKKRTALAVLLILAALPAQARSWKPQGSVLAQDYSVITDNRPNHELVQVFWMTWPMTASSSQTMRQLLDHYIILGLSHGQLDPGGKMIFEKTESAQATSLDGTALKSIAVDSYPPAVAGAVSAMGSFMRQSMGAMGEGMTFMVFESGNVRACEKGQLSVRYAGETYIYDTPIPGCPAP